MLSSVLAGNKLLMIISTAAVLLPFCTWKYFFSVYTSLKRQYEEEVLFRKRHNCVVMYTASKGMSGWPPYEGRIVPDITNKNCLDVLYEPMIYFILTAKNTLDVACMMIGIEKIYEALVQAKRNGARVRMLLNSEHSNNMLSNIRTCIEEGIEVQMYISQKTPNMSSIMHYKFMVKDCSETVGYVLTGSMNINRSAVLENYEDIVFISDHYVANAFQDNFGKCFNYVKVENESLINKTTLMNMNLL